VKSYIRDSTDFLLKLPKTVPGAFHFCTVDVVNLYGSIPHSLGLRSLKYFTEQYGIDPNRIPVDFVLEAAEFILKNNFFTFNGKDYKQLEGTAMGTKFAPCYAILTLGFLEETQLYPELINRFSSDQAEFIMNNFYRYIDDCFIIWPDEFPPLTDFINILNGLHPSIKFTKTTSSRTKSHFWMSLYMLKITKYTPTSSGRKQTR
jgi:hypothetical protein